MKWSNFTIHEKNTRIKMTIFFVGLSVVLIYTMGIHDFTSLLGTMALIWGVLYLIKEIKLWFKK